MPDHGTIERGEPISMNAAHCPRDGSQLQQGAFYKVPLLLCGGCHGVLVQQQSLHPLLTAMAREMYKDISFEEELEPVPDRGAGIACPSCQCKMENYGYMGGNKVMIDCCTQCMKLWIDTNELAAMCFMNERANKRMDQYREAWREQIRRLDMYNVQDIMKGAFQRGFVLGGLLF